MRKIIPSLFCCILFLSIWTVPSPNASAEPIAVIINETNQIDNITSGELARIYSGRARRWRNGKKIAIINRPIDSEIRFQFYKVILGAKPSKKFFKSKLPVPFNIMKLKSALATRKFVAHFPNAIGYVYLSEVDDTVKVLKIDGILPDQKDYKLN